MAPRLAALSVLFALLLASGAEAVTKWNQTSQYSIEVTTSEWTNYASGGGCVTCPYTCVAPTEGPSGIMNTSNSTYMASIPSIYSTAVSNGCCYASASDSSVSPTCAKEASPATAEPCGFLYGPTLSWRISSATVQSKLPTENVIAMLFASTDCKNFWAVAKTPIRYISNTKSVTGEKVMNGGCYGDASGQPMILAGCLSSTLTFSKSKTYTWKDLAQKCQGVSGICAITNGNWGEQLKCCTSRSGLTSTWDKTYKLYTATTDSSITLSGPAIFGIVVAFVLLMLALVHYGAKARERARQTALMREQEATDDYEEIMTPLTGAAAVAAPAALTRQLGPSQVEVSLHEGDQIFRKKDAELLYEGDMY